MPRSNGQQRPLEYVRPFAPGELGARPGVILLLTADTGGGHRAAAEALRQALTSRYAGRLVALTCNPLTGAEANRVVDWVCRRYGPLVRVAPWLWSPLFHASNTRVGLWVVRRLLTRVASARIGAAVARHRPLAVLSLHPLLITPAVAVLNNPACRPVSQRAHRLSRPALVTVVTDLGTVHRSWSHPAVDRLVAPTADLLHQTRRHSATPLEHCDVLGIPVRERFRPRPADPAMRAALRASLSLAPDRFVVLVTAGAEGGRGMEAWTRAIVTGNADVDVVAVCGRNDRLRARLDRLASGHRQLTVAGFVDNMADWLRASDVVVTKAGPGIIAEAAACGVPMLLAGHLPGQEVGNTELVTRAGAGRAVRGTRQLRADIEHLRSNPASLERMAAAALRLGRPSAAAEIADLLAREVGLCGRPAVR